MKTAVEIIYIVCVFSAILVGLSDGISRATDIVIENNEFKRILVAINDDVPENAALVQHIKDAFTLGSAILYNATNQRAVFRDVTILVPESWSNHAAYSPATTQLFNNADVIFSAPISANANPPAAPPPDGGGVDAGESGDRGSMDPDWTIQYQQLQRQAAQTKTYAGCGHPGIRVTMTTDVLTDRRVQGTVGPPEKVLVHEWAHFRWGVFDEYALTGEPQFYFSPTTGNLEGIRCTEMVQGIIIKSDRTYCRTLDPNTGLYPNGCSFQPYPAGPTTIGVDASIMDRANIKSTFKFCDDNQSNNSTKHNYDAPSRHNRLCGHRSIWDVINSSPDFAGGKNPPRAGVDTAPVFNVVQTRTARRLVLALDSSASMAQDQKLIRMKQAVGTFISDGVQPDTFVGLTSFNVDTTVRNAPLSLNTTQDRQTLVADLPDSHYGATDLSAAFTSAAQLLRGDQAMPPSNSSHPPSRHARTSGVSPPSQPAPGGHVLMVTDGQETSGKDILSVLPSLKNSGVIVTVVVLGGPPTEELEQLAMQTGGRVYCDNNFATSTATVDALFDIVDIHRSRSTPSPVQILSRAEGLDEQQSMEGYFSVDPELGRSTTILVAYDIIVPDVRVTSPSGRVYSHLYTEYSLDLHLQIAKILIPSIAEIGKWSYKITNPDEYQRVSLLVLSTPTNTTVQPVHLSGMLMWKQQPSPPAMHIFAEVTRGDDPVTGLHVTALVDLPDGSSQKVELYDNGAGADIVENDGVYSRYLTKMTIPGLYTVQLHAAGHDDRAEANDHYDLKTPVDPRNKFVQRTASAGYVVIRHTGNSTIAQASSDSGSGNYIDIEAPVRISDLRVIKTSSENRTVVLSWRASGDDSDKDTASHYEVYMAPKALDLMKGTDRVTNLTQSDVVHGDLVAPKPFGSREYLMIRIPAALSANTRFVFTVVAVDEAGNKGEHSNYVTVVLELGPASVPDVTDWRYWPDGNKQFQAAEQQVHAPQKQKMLIAILLGTTTGLLVIVIIVSVIVSFVTEWKKRKALFSTTLPTTVSKRAHTNGSSFIGTNYERQIYALS